MQACNDGNEIRYSHKNNASRWCFVKKIIRNWFNISDLKYLIM